MVKTSDGADSAQTTLVTRVRTVINDAGINHSEVARRIGIDASKLSKSLAGVRKFRVEEISLIAELTGVTTDWLTTGTSARPPRRRMVADLPLPTSDAPDDQPDDSTLPTAPAREWMSKGTRNRLRIIAAAWRLYADRGIDKVRTEDVAEAAGVSASAVNYHFRTKDQLLQAALRYSLDIIAETRHLNGSHDSLDVLRHFAQIHAGVDAKIRRVWSIWLQCWARAATDHAARANLLGVYGEWMDMIAAVIDSGQRAGTIRTGDTALMVKSLSIFIDGLGIARSTEQVPITDEEALRMLEKYLDAHVLLEPGTDHSVTRNPQPEQEATVGRTAPTS